MFFFFFQAEDGIRDYKVTGVQTCALPISEDKQILRRMIEAHHKYTGSRKAKLVLDSWEAMLPKFVKIMPIDYKRVLAERKAAAAKGQAQKDKELVTHG